MTDRFDRIEAAIAQATSDVDCTAAQEIRVALQYASEPERDALVKPLTALLRHWRNEERQDSRWWPQRQLTEIALVACEPGSAAMRRRLTLHSDDEDLFAILVDRRPDWMADVMQDLFTTKLPRDLLEDRNWLAAERLRRILGAPRPLDERNAIALGVHLGQQVPMEEVRELSDGVPTSATRSIPIERLLRSLSSPVNASLTSSRACGQAGEPAEARRYSGMATRQPPSRSATAMGRACTRSISLLQNPPWMPTTRSPLIAT